MEHTLLPKVLALPIFASDALSSVAYSVEASLVILVGASANVHGLILPDQLAVAAVMAIVITSYRQVVRAYPTSAGSYVVSKENLATIFGLIAAAALLADYVLTVAVSVSSGILAISSAMGGGLNDDLVGISIACVILITLVNLRGVRESGIAFATPTYVFILAMFALIVVGLARCLGIVPAGDRRSGSGPGRDRRGGRPVRDPALLRLRLVGPHRDRGDLERRQRVPASAGPQRLADARASWA